MELFSFARLFLFKLDWFHHHRANCGCRRPPSTSCPHAPRTSNERLWSWGTRASDRHTNRIYLQEERSCDHLKHLITVQNKHGSGSASMLVTWLWRSSLFTREEREDHRHPANDVGPREPPVAVAFPVVINGYPSVHSHGEKHQEAWEGGQRSERSTWRSIRNMWCLLSGRSVQQCPLTEQLATDASTVTHVLILPFPTLNWCWTGVALVSTHVFSWLCAHSIYNNYYLIRLIWPKQHLNQVCKWCQMFTFKPF